MGKILHVHERKPHAFNDETIRSMVATNIFGGGEIKTSSIGAVIYLLLKSTSALANLQQEIDEVCHECSGPSDVTIALHQAQSMRYLQAVIYESMRLFPVDGLPLARVSPPGSLEINGS